MLNRWKWLVKFCQKFAIWGPSYYSVPKSTCFCSDLSCKYIMVSSTCLISFSSLISKLEHDQLFKASYVTVSSLKIIFYLTKLLVWNLWHSNRMYLTNVDPDFRERSSSISQIFKWVSAQGIRYLVCYAKHDAKGNHFIHGR